MAAVLKIEQLEAAFTVNQARVAAVRGVSLQVERGKTMVILGESGSGKSMTLRAILKITPPGAMLTGSIRYQDRELLECSAAELQRIRGNRIAMVFRWSRKY